MKTERKLKLGLADLSRLFAQVSEPLKEKEESVGRKHLIIEPPHEDLLNEIPPCFICTGLFSAGNSISVSELMQLVGATSSLFQEVALFTLSPSRTRQEAFKQYFQIPGLEHEKAFGKSGFYSITDGLVYGSVTPAYLDMALESRGAGIEEIPNWAGKERIMVAFDATTENGTGSFTRGRVLDLIDHAAFLLRPDADELMKTYELMRLSIAKNQNLKCSIFLSGHGAKESGEFLYEQFSDIVSRFLGADLGFLGWAEAGEVQINPELVLEEGSNIFQISSKARLKEVFCQQTLSV